VTAAAPVLSTASLASHPADRLLDAFDRFGAPISVGLDPVLDRLPEALRSLKPVDAIERFSVGVLEAIAEHVACVKIQSACYERFGADGVAALHRVSVAAKERGFEVILDAKRGDIGITAEHYAAASVGHKADWTTVNGYLGADGIAPFLKIGGAFALVRTSNPSGDALQSLRLSDGRSIAEALADLVVAIGAGSVGARGFSSLGATKRQDAAALRARMPEQIFLVPGYGAQGGGVDDVLPCFRADGRGAIVTASRSVLYPEGSTDTRAGSWQGAIERAAAAFRNEIRRGLGGGAAR
jgi:orotidine-5'-phosphate decarboxylase